MDHNYYIAKILDMKKGFISPISSILNYKKVNNGYICSSYFGENIDDVNLSNIDLLMSDVSLRIHGLTNLMHQIELDIDVSDFFKKVLIENIKDLLSKFEIINYSFFIEAEKSGFFIDSHDMNTDLKKINYLLDKVYGKKIIDTPNEREEILIYLKSLFEKNKNFISSDDQTFFEGKLCFANIPISNFDLSSIQDFGTIIIDDAIMTFIMVFEALGFDGWKIEVDDNRLFVSVRWEQKKLYIPGNLKVLKFKRLCELIDHEILTHALRGENTSVLFGDSTSDFVYLEEGLALLNERLVTSDFDEIKILPSIHSISIFFGECFDFQTSIKLLDIYFQLEGYGENCNEMAVSRALRVKRFSRLSLPGADRKDLIYNRGFKDIYDLYQKNHDDGLLLTKKLYLGKIGFSYIADYEKMKSDFGVGDKKIINPVRIGKLMYHNIILGKEILENSLIDDIRVKGMVLDNEIIFRITLILDFVKSRLIN